MDQQLYEEEEFARLIRPVMLIGKMTALWPLEEDVETGDVVLRGIQAFCIYILLGIIAFSVTADVFHNLDNIEEATECALICSAFYLSLLRLSIYRYYAKDMVYVVNTMRRDWLHSTYEDKLVLKEKTNFAYQLSKYFVTGVMMTSFMFTFVPLLEMFVLGGSERILPFRGYFFINHTVSPIFECLFVVNVSGGTLGASTIGAATSFNFVAITHASAKFAVLRRKLAILDGEDSNAADDMAVCVAGHRKAIAFAETLERIISFLALGQFVISTGLLCLAGFQITAMMEDMGRLAKYVSFLNCAILELFMFSFSGSSLIDESEAIGESAYSCKWIGTRLPQSLQIMMMRSRIPSKITAAKFYNMSLESFATVLSTSFSYFTVLTAMNDTTDALLT